MAHWRRIIARLRSLLALFGVGRHDPITILSVCALLAVSGLVAAIIPARRAASIDPMQALRTEWEMPCMGALAGACRE